MNDAIIFAFNTGSRQSNYFSRHGGEVLLNRQLVALSKSGFKRAWIFTPVGEADRMRSLIKEVAQRLLLTYEIIETPESNLGEAVASLSTVAQSEVLITQADIILHPTLLKPIVTTPRSGAPVLYTYGHVTLHSSGAEFDERVPAKFRVIFRQPNHFRRIRTEGAELARCHLLVAAVRPDYLKTFSKAQAVEDIWDHLEEGRHDVQAIGDAWWLQVNDSQDQSTLRDFFWGIAFKEISGEFSKAVNSKLSKPLSFWFATHRISPNTISAIQLVLFFVSSAFLLLPSPWSFILFAVCWQFSAGILDRCDGETARIRNYESEAGAKFDVLVDDLRFIVPFAAITTRLMNGSPDISYFLGFSITLIFFFTLTYVELRFMRRAGYLSRQVMGVDYTRSLTPGSSWARFFGRFRPFFKGDARTFMIALLSFTFNAQLIYWVLLLNLVYMALQGAALIFHLRKKVKTASSHNAELVRT